ncbi:MAG: hypothetical protein EOM54_14550 [Clostridia bacterium]|nr:hypothetical protein [Clostridia bacterium]
MKKPYLAYRRHCAGLIAFILCASVLAGCGGSPNGAGGKREIPAPGESSEATQDVSQTLESNQSIEVQGTASQYIGTIASLDEIRQKAISAGYETADLVEIQMTMAEGIADGFNIVIGDWQNPVLEFETVETAQAYAEYVNAAGTGAVIVNGRFFTYLEALEDGSIDEDSLQVLEGFMDNSALTRPDASEQDYLIVSESTSDYKGAYALMAQINTAMSTLLNQSLEEYNKEYPEGDPKNAGEVMPLLFNSIDLCFTAYFCEDEAAYAGIVAAAEMVGITETKMTRNGAHDYTLSGKAFGGKAFEIHGLYDPATGGLRMVENTEGTITEFFEFIPLGDGQYAFQNDTERASAVYQDGSLKSFIYTRTGSNAGYDNETDSIFPAGISTDGNWIAGLGENDYAEYYAFDGRTIKLNAKTFGGRIITEISDSVKAS